MELQAKVIISKQFSIAWRDALRGGILAALSSAIVIVQGILDKGSLAFNWKQIGMVAIGTFLSYLIKNGVLEPTKVITTPIPTADAEQVKADIKQVV